MQILRPVAADDRVFEAAPLSPLVEQVAALLATGICAQVLRLDRWAMRLAGEAEPACLLLTAEEGGYARRGFWLAEGASRRWVDAPTVEMVVDPAHLAGFDSTFAHEMGHVIVRRLLGDVSTGPCRKTHASLVVTDYPTAFDEGFAEHFEVLLADQAVPGAGVAVGAAADLIGVWLSNVDSAWRIDGVRRNAFVHRKAAVTPAPGADPFETWRDGETLPLFLPDQLKNGQAMMASEGVGATLFYRLVTADALRSRYCEPEFYAAVDAENVTPYENVTLKLMAAMRQLRPFAAGRPLLAELVEAYAQLFPDEAAGALLIFLETTWGATVAPAVARELEEMAVRGRRGDLEGFRTGFRAAYDKLLALRDDLLAGCRRLTDGLGPELWLLHDRFLIPHPAWSQERTVPLSVNLNTADEPELATIPGVGWDGARRLVALRRERGIFASLDEAGPELQPVLAEMARRMRSAGDVRRI